MKNEKILVVGDASFVDSHSYYQFILEIVTIKQKFLDKLFIHRIDDPIILYNTMNYRRDI